MLSVILLLLLPLPETSTAGKTDQKTEPPLSDYSRYNCPVCMSPDLSGRTLDCVKDRYKTERCAEGDSCWLYELSGTVSVNFPNTNSPPLTFDKVIKCQRDDLVHQGCDHEKCISGSFRRVDEEMIVTSTTGTIVTSTTETRNEYTTSTIESRLTTKDIPDTQECNEEVQNCGADRPICYGRLMVDGSVDYFCSSFNSEIDCSIDTGCLGTCAPPYVSCVREPTTVTTPTTTLSTTAGGTPQEEEDEEKYEQDEKRWREDVRETSSSTATLDTTPTTTLPTTAGDMKRWRDDGKCGSWYPLPDGNATECDPDGETPCCSDSEWGNCGNTAYHCTCEGCTDYRDVEKWREEGEKRWRDDGGCGSRYLLPDGNATECDPDGETPCCSGWSCGETVDHCTCVGCTDYRKVKKWRETDTVESECISEIHAAFSNPTEKYAYIISRGQYVRLEADDRNMPVVSEGYPQYVAEQWPGVEGEVDAAFTDYHNGRTFFFVKRKPRRKVYCWNWNDSEMEMNGEDERNTIFVALPQSDIKGIASYRDHVLFLFENEYYLWTPQAGLYEEAQTWPYQTGDKSVHVSGAFDAFLRGHFHTGSQQAPEKYVLLRSRKLIEGDGGVEKYSYRRFEEDMDLQMCSI